MKLIFLIVFILSSCVKQSEPELLLDILTNRYANIEVNKIAKLSELRKIKSILYTNGLSERSAIKINEHLKKMGDHHLKLRRIITSPHPQECISSKVFSTTTYLIKIHSLWCESREKTPFRRFVDEFNLHAKKAHKYPNLIIDLRDNGGGGDRETRYLLQRLITKKSFLYSYQYLNANLPFYKRSGQKWAKRTTEYLMPVKSDKNYLGNKKLLVIVNNNTFSSAEVVASVLKNSNQAIIVGKRTKGGAGDPKTAIFINGKFELIYPTCLVWQEDGTLYEGIGVLPNFKTIEQAKKEILWP